jgi:hypothetical protein
MPLPCALLCSACPAHPPNLACDPQVLIKDVAQLDGADPVAAADEGPVLVAQLDQQLLDLPGGIWVGGLPAFRCADLQIAQLLEKSAQQAKRGDFMCEIAFNIGS